MRPSLGQAVDMNVNVRYLFLDVLDAVFGSLLIVHHYGIHVLAHHLGQGKTVPAQDRGRQRYVTNK